MLKTVYADRGAAEMVACTGNRHGDAEYTVEEVLDVSNAGERLEKAEPVKPPIGVMPRRVWEEQRIRALAEAIVRVVGHGEACATVFRADYVRDWAAEIVDLCERMEGKL